MTEHYSHVGRAEKLAAAGSVVRLVFGGGSGGSGGSSGGSVENQKSAETDSRSTLQN
jgi:hypothetical protein